MTEIRTCWALNKNLQRCDMPAGHPGDHAITATWADEDCYNPAIPTPTTNPGSATAGPPALPVTEHSPEPTGPVKCAACGHAHKGGTCKCDCYEFIG